MVVALAAAEALVEAAAEVGSSEDGPQSTDDRQQTNSVHCFTSSGVCPLFSGICLLPSATISICISYLNPQRLYSG